MTELTDRLIDLHRRGSLNLPLPGAGLTSERYRRLAEFGQVDLSLARLAEGHTDAVAILAEWGRHPSPGAVYGVWASDGPQGQVRVERLAAGGWRLNGTKQYCSGANFLDVALVTAHAEEGLLLFSVPLKQAGVRSLPSTWATPALADTVTAPVEFSGVRLSSDAVVGCADWYLQRPGFWHGAMGPAACWAGGAISLTLAAGRLRRTDPHARAHSGAMQAISWGLMGILEQAGREIDADPDDAQHQAQRRALMARHLIERWATEVMDRFGRMTGPQLLAFDGHVARQFAALSLYIRQCHAERDLECIGTV